MKREPSLSVAGASYRVDTFNDMVSYINKCLAASCRLSLPCIRALVQIAVLGARLSKAGNSIR